MNIMNFDVSKEFMSELWNTILNKQPLDQKQAEFVFSKCLDHFKEELFKKADQVRKNTVGNDVFIRGIIEFSNVCKCDCYYCGISIHNKKLKRYRMNINEILATIEQAYNLGFRSFVLQSGEDQFYTQKDICNIVSKIKESYNVAITLSIGEWSKEAYKDFKIAGADRYLLRIETSNKELYQKLHPNSNWEERHKCIMYLKELDYQVGSGILIGLPGQTPQMLADDLIYLKNLKLEMVGIGPFIPHPETPLANEQGGDLNTCLTFLALLRLYMPDSFLPATTALASIDPNGRQKALLVGANVVMPNVSPVENRELYQLYPGKICLTDNALKCSECIVKIITSLSRIPNFSHGHITRKVF